VPTIDLKVLSSSNKNAASSEWMQIAYVGQQTTLLFLKDVKRYCKFVVEIDSDSDISSSDFLLLVQVEIAEITTPVITDHARSVLARFPSWTKIYGDSIERSTPELALPQTNAGKLINAVIGEDLDSVDNLISRIELDSFITSSDENQPAWLFVYNNVKPGFVKVTGDNLELARTSSMRELLEHRQTDYVFYYNFVTGQIFTLIDLNQLKVDNVLFDPEVVQNINSFDEFGLRVGLQRLYLESNENFKNRILDVYQNPPAINADGLKKTLRRELDIWRAYSSTPDSDYVGATPELLEISDIELDTRYFSKDGVPTGDFRDFVEYLNKQYPSNFGYIQWNESYWDPAGSRREGFSSIPQITDSATSSYYEDHYQPGVGDFNDIKIKLEKLDQGVQDYSIGIRAVGIKKSGEDQAYEPVSIIYDSHISYYEDYVDNEVATVNYEVVLHLNLHGDIPNDSKYSAKYTAKVRNDYDVVASPEYHVKDIFNPQGYTNGEAIFYNEGGTPYFNTFAVSATESYSFTEIPLYAVDSATVNFIAAFDSSGATASYASIGFLNATPDYYATNTSKTITKNADQINDSPYATKLKVISNIYNPKKRRIVNTPKIRSNRFGNLLNNSIDIGETSNIEILPRDIIKDFILPFGSTPIYVYITNVVEDSYDIDLSASPYQGYGGVSLNKRNNKKYLIPSQENILFSFVNPNFATPTLHEYYVDTTGSSTVNYRFIEVKFPYSATPDSLVISSTPSQNYPFNYLQWENFTADYVGEISFKMSDDGVVSEYSTVNYDIDAHGGRTLVGSFDFLRSDFGLEQYSASPDLMIFDMYPIYENDDIYVSVDHQYPYVDLSGSTVQYDYSSYSPNTFINSDEATPFGILNYYDQNIDQFISKGIQIHAYGRPDSNNLINPTLESGWLFQNGTPYYMFADGYSEFRENQNEIVLSSIARQGAPVIVEVHAQNEESAWHSTPYTQVSFLDEATPTEMSLYNTEYILAKHDNYLALAYQDIFDVSVLDTYTGEYIIESSQYSSNIIETESIGNEPVIKSGREYKVKYRVLDTYNIDNQYYNELDNSYRTKVTLLSTPNSPYYTFVSYETSIFDTDTTFSETALNPLYSPLGEGYIFLSKKEYLLDSVEAKISPKEILDNGSQIIAVNLFSKDLNSNPKPWIKYQITGDSIEATPSVIETNEDGYARVYVRYTGQRVTYPSISNIYISETDSATPTTSATVNYYIKPETIQSNRLLAEVTKKIINADGQETVNILGSATPSSYVYWRRGRSLYEALNTPYSISSSTPDQSGKSGLVTSDSSGEFLIGPYRTQNDATPGYWFVVVDTEMASTPNLNPNTVAGDIVYWYEKYDVNQSSSFEPYLIADQGSTANYYHYLTDSSFKKDFATDKVYYEDVFEDTWNLPKWYPISRYTQYQMGLMGSTPYIIDTYENLHPDYEEE
jgi:hypothetical protein